MNLTAFAWTDSTVRSLARNLAAATFDPAAETLSLVLGMARKVP